jgi:hypothetical protein
MNDRNQLTHMAMFQRMRLGDLQSCASGRKQLVHEMFVDAETKRQTVSVSPVERTIVSRPVQDCKFSKAIGGVLECSFVKRGVLVLLVVNAQLLQVGTRMLLIVDVWLLLR